jgi:hypothetical protein
LGPILVKGWFLVLVTVFGFWLVPGSNFDIDFFPQNLKLMVEILNNQNWPKPGTSQQWFSHLV